MFFAAETIPYASKRETQFRVRPRPDLGGDGIRFFECGPCSLGAPGKMLRLGPAAEQDAEAHTV